MRIDWRFSSSVVFVLAVTGCNGSFPSNSTPASDWTRSSTQSQNKEIADVDGFGEGTPLRLKAKVPALYVANDGSDNVSGYTIDTKTGQLKQVEGSPFGAGTEPFGVAGQYFQNKNNWPVYVTDYGSDDISGYTVNQKTGSLTPVAGSPFGAGTGPTGAAVVKNGRSTYIYATNEGSNNVSAYAVNAKSGALTQVKGSPFVAGTGPVAAAVEADDPASQPFLYVVNNGSDNVSAYTINTKTGALTAVSGSPFKAASQPDGVAIVPDGGTGYLYVANYGSDNVSAYTINLKTGTLTEVYGSPFGAGTWPFGLASIVINSGASYLYATNEGSDNVSAYAVNASSGALTQVTGSPFGAGTEPIDATICVGHSYSYYLYATNSGSNNVSGYAIDASSGALTQLKGSPYSAGTGPYGIAGC
jgi:6-phosphogluconolactonase (cycloisomerase 2 family)